MSQTLTAAPTSPASIEQVPMLVGGKWSTSSSSRGGDVWNPSTGQKIARVPFCSADEVNKAVEVAHAALPDWANKPVVQRCHYLFKFRELLVQHAEEIARCVHARARQNPRRSASLHRPRHRSRRIRLRRPIAHHGQSIMNIAREVDCETIRHPVGVCAGITPFNFPAMVPLWMYPIAIACGNTFILKPSEKVPLSSVLIGKLLQEAGLPDGVFNIVHGDKEAVDACSITRR
jgi:malonate-semialdehyde dehydrogenase (acetylating)/methylmalonate-semialdehyde dehydrogenase